jgi:hypothetical protein
MSAAFPLVFILALFATPCSAQGNKSINDGNDKQNALPKVIKKSGWDIPITGEIESSITQIKVFDNYPITIKWSRPKSQTYLKFSSRVNFKVISFGAYITEGKTFAYVFRCLSPGESAIIIVYFADEDGDGKFETKYPSKLPDKIPAWIPKDENKIERPPPPIKRAAKQQSRR